MRLSSLLLVLAVTIASLASVGATTLPDRCRPSTNATGTAEDGKFYVELKFDETKRKWLFESAVDGKQVATGEIGELQWHAHPSVLVSPQGDRFVVFDPSATRRHNDRVIIYSMQGEKLKSLGVDDLLTKEEMKSVRQSVSHLWWTESHNTKGNAWLSDDGKFFELLAAGTKRTVKVALY